MVRGKSEGKVVRGKDNERKRSSNFERVVAVIVALEHYRTPPIGDALPNVDHALADANSFAAVVREMFDDMPEQDVDIRIIADQNASLTGLRNEVGYTIHGLSKNDLFIFYYAGHGFHGAGGNRLSAYDTIRTNIDGTSFLLNADLLEPLADSECSQALVFIDACAEKFREVGSSRDVISNLDPEEVEEFLNSGWYCGVFLSCSPGEKSYPSSGLGHGIWTHFLLEAMSGRAVQALTQDRWLTDFGLRDYLRQEVPRYITRETSIRGKQTPQAIISATNTFQIRHVAPPPVVPADAALAAIKLRNNNEFLDQTETGDIRQLGGFQRGFHKVPDNISDSADKWCRRLLDETVKDDLQQVYEYTMTELNLRRKDVRKEQGDGSGSLDTSAFRYSIETGQNPDEPSEYIIRRCLKLRQGWPEYRAAIDKIFGYGFDTLVVEFDRMDETYNELVDILESIRDEHGGKVHDDDRKKRVTYKRDDASFIFDLKKRRLEISFNDKGALALVDATQKFQLGIGKSSQMLLGSSPKAPILSDDSTETTPSRSMRNRSLPRGS